MRRRPFIRAVLVVIAAAVIPAYADDARPVARTWSFETDPVGGVPAGFTFSQTDGRDGRWTVREAADAPSGSKVLAQSDDDHAKGAAPIAIADGLLLADLRVTVRCKPYSGHVNQVCGVVFRYGDDEDYYLARADVLEAHVRLYYVKAGRRTRIGNWRGVVRAGAWQELRADAHGQRFQVYWNGKQVIDVTDDAFVDAGKVGVWTESDAITEFDDLSVTPLS